MNKKIIFNIFLIISAIFGNILTENSKIEPKIIPGASYFFKKSGGKMIEFYTFDGNLIKTIKHNNYLSKNTIKKYLDPYAPRPQPFYYEILQFAFEDMSIYFYDKNSQKSACCLNHEIAHYRYNKSDNTISTTIRDNNFFHSNDEKFKKYFLHDSNAIKNFPLDLSNIRDFNEGRFESNYYKYYEDYAEQHIKKKFEKFIINTCTIKPKNSQDNVSINNIKIIPNASYFIKKLDTIEFYTFDGDFILSIEETTMPFDIYHNKDMIKKYLDPNTPKPQPIRYTITIKHKNKEGIRKWIKIRFFDKNCNVLTRYRYFKELNLMQKDNDSLRKDRWSWQYIIEKGPYQLDELHSVNFPLDLSIANNTEEIITSVEYASEINKAKEFIEFFKINNKVK